MFFGFQLTCGLMMVFYGYSVMKNPRVWGDQGRRAVKPEHFEEYGRQNGLFFLKAGCVMAVIGALDALVTLDALLYLLLYVFGFAFAFYPLTSWCKANEGFSWPWPHVKSEKKRIKELRKDSRRKSKPEPRRAARVLHAGGLFLRHSLREAGYLAKFDFLNEATLKKQLRQHGKIQHVWQGWNFANREQLCQVGKHQKLNVDKL